MGWRSSGGPPTEAAYLMLVAEVETMADIGVLAAAVVTCPLLPVDELHLAMSTPAARASTDTRLTPSSGAR
jgi:hypothetical protein